MSCVNLDSCSPCILATIKSFFETESLLYRSTFIIESSASKVAFISIEQFYYYNYTYLKKIFACTLFPKTLASRFKSKEFVRIILLSLTFSIQKALGTVYSNFCFIDIFKAPLEL